MRNYVVPVLGLCVAAGLLAAPASVNAAEVTIHADTPVVELNVTELVRSTPDIAIISTGVTSDAPTAVAALQQNSLAMRRLIDQLKAAGIAEKDMQTSGISINQRFDYNQETQANEFRGYQVTNQLTVTVRGIDRIGALLDTMVGAGATNVNGPFFAVADDSALKAEARRKALARGREQALDYARAAGFKDVRLLAISESLFAESDASANRALKVESAAASSDLAPVQPGQVGTSVSILVKYAMVP